MARVRSGQVSFNAGEFGEEMAARIDFERFGLAASLMSNWIPLAQGGMTRRQGFKTLASGVSAGRLMAFSSPLALDYLAICNAGSWAFWYDEARITTEDNSVTITNGVFAAGLAGWTDSSTGAATATGTASGLELEVPASGSGIAMIDQQITATSGLTYSVVVTVATGPVNVKFGSAAGASDYRSGTIEAGEHVFEITPTSSNFWVRLASGNRYVVVVTSIADYSNTAVSLSNSYTSGDLDDIHKAQVADVMFLASENQEFASLSRRSTSGFGFGAEMLRGGPLDTPDPNGITLTPDGVSSTVTITASEPLFEAGDVGRSMQITHAGQDVSLLVSAENTFTDTIKVTGSGTFRQFKFIVTGTSTSTVTAQRSFVSDTGPWDDKSNNFTSPHDETFDDELDGQTVWYRIGVKTGNYVDPVTVALEYAAGSTVGEAVITSFTSSTEVDVRVIEPFYAAEESSDWRLSVFGGTKGYPSSVAFHEGRMWLAGGNSTFGSVSDDYTNFAEGLNDDDAISRRAASVVRWLTSAGELAAGLNDKLAAGRTSDLDAPYTPTNFRLRDYSTEGAKRVEPVAVDQAAIFVRRDGETVSEFAFSQQTTGYNNVSLTRLHPKITLGGVKRLAFQRAPERRVWVLKETGELLVLTYLRDENVVGWSRVEMEGFVEDVAVVAGEGRDRVYVHTLRDGVRRLMVYADEQWDSPSQSNCLDYSRSLEPETRDAVITPSAATGTITVAASASVFTGSDVGRRIYMLDGYGDVTAQSGTSATVDVVVPLISDAFGSVQRVPSGFWRIGDTSTTVSGLTDMIGESVYAFADGIDVGPFTVDGSGEITLSTAAGWVHAGLRNQAKFRAMKNSSGTQAGIGIAGVTKRMNEMGIVYYKTGDCLRAGLREADNTDVFVIQETRDNPGAVATGEAVQRLDGEHSLDPRAWIIAEKAAPATVLGYSTMVKANER